MVFTEGVRPVTAKDALCGKSWTVEVRYCSAAGCSDWVAWTANPLTLPACPGPCGQLDQPCTSHAPPDIDDWFGEQGTCCAAGRSCTQTTCVLDHQGGTEGTCASAPKGRVAARSFLFGPVADAGTQGVEFGFTARVNSVQAPGSPGAQGAGQLASDLVPTCASTCHGLRVGPLVCSLSHLHASEPPPADLGTLYSLVGEWTAMRRVNNDAQQTTQYEGNPDSMLWASTTTTITDADGSFVVCINHRERRTLKFSTLAIKRQSRLYRLQPAGRCGPADRCGRHLHMPLHSGWQLLLGH